MSGISTPNRIFKLVILVVILCLPTAGNAQQQSGLMDKAELTRFLDKLDLKITDWVSTLGEVDSRRLQMSYEDRPALDSARDSCVELLDNAQEWIGYVEDMNRMSDEASISFALTDAQHCVTKLLYTHIVPSVIANENTSFTEAWLESLRKIEVEIRTTQAVYRRHVLLRLFKADVAGCQQIN